MRATRAAVTHPICALLTLATLHCTRVRETITLAPVSAVAPAPRVVTVTPIAPSARPVGFDEDIAERDVDGDGLVDRVRLLPSVEASGGRTLRFDALPPALVAHRLADGRYAVDDDITRAALRALCPEAPGARFVIDASVTMEGDPTEHPARTLYLDAFCALAWGRSLDDVGSAMREAVAGTDGGVPGLTPSLVDGMLRALARLRFAFVSRDGVGDFPPLAPTSTTAISTDATNLVEPDVSPRTAACRASEAATERLRLQALREASRRPRPSNADELSTTLTDTRRCAQTHGATWTLRFASMDFAREVDQAFRGAMQVVCAPSSSSTPWRGAPLPHAWLQGLFQSTTYAIEALFDWDGDGRAEAAVREHIWTSEDHGSSALLLFTARDGAVAAYPPAARLGVIESLVDADGDGRRDLVLPSRWRFTDNCGMAGLTHVGPTQLAHALPDGTFSTDDGVTRAWVTHACQRLRHEDDDLTGVDRDVWRIACARSHGASPDEIVRALRGAHPGRPRVQPTGNDQVVCFPFQDLAALALIGPPRR